MWSLLPTSVLKSNGEATYYLTLISSAINTYKTGKTDTTSSTPQTEVSTVQVLKIVLSCIYSRKAIVFLGKSHWSIMYVSFPFQEHQANNTSSLKSCNSSISQNSSSPILTVYIPEQNTLASKNVPLRNENGKVKDVESLLTHMMAVANPSDHALYSIIDGQGINSITAYQIYSHEKILVYF